MVWILGLVLWSGTGAVSAQVVLESVTNTALTGSGPTGNGPSVSPVVLTLRHNTNNPAGNTMAARPAPVTATFSLTNQQFSGLTPAQGYPASTGGYAVFFGGSTSGSTTPSSVNLFTSLSGIGSPSASQFTSVNATAGQGIEPTVNAGVFLAVSANAITAQAPSTPTNARVRMADLVITFNVPVDNPIVHFSGMGSIIGASPINMSAEFELITPGLTIDRLSGNSAFVVAGNEINNSTPVPSTSCAGPGACGSVRVNGTGITAVTLRTYLRGAGGVPSWSGSQFNLEALAVGVSVAEPPPKITLTKVSDGGIGTFSFTGTNGFPASQSITTATSGVGVEGATVTLTGLNSVTTVTETSASGGSYELSSISCTGLGAGGTATPTIPNGSNLGSVQLNAAATAMGADIRCVFTNTLRRANVSIGKSSSMATATPGQLVLFSLTVTNAGPSAAHGTSVTDPAATGLDCVAAGLPAPTCSATPGSACPVAGTLTAANLQSASGVVIPTLPNAGVVTIGLTCRVTASGF